LSFLVYQPTEGNDYQKVLLTSTAVKRKIAFENGLGFLAQIEDLPLKCCIDEQNAKNNLSGRNPRFYRKNLPPFRI